MSDYIIRKLTAADAPQAAKLWHTVFGDDEALVLEFFRLFSHTPTFGICAERSGQIAAAAYCPTGTDHISPTGHVTKGVYLYAVATHPDHRKQGLAKKICVALRDLAFGEGIDFLFTRPSEESLYPWYEKKIGAVPLLGGQRLEYKAEPCAPAPLQSLTAADYFTARSRCLDGLPHIRHSMEWLTWESLLHKAYGGGFFAFDGCIADLYQDGDSLVINELLPRPTNGEAVLQSLMAALSAEKCVWTAMGREHYVSAVSRTAALPHPDAWFGPFYG